VAFEFAPLDTLPDVLLITPKTFGDERGWFLESYRQSEFVANGITFGFVQQNHSCSTKRGVLRGLHYQKNPMAQGKLVRCIVGEVFDVAVDIRRGSPTYGNWVGTELSASNHRILWAPPGFAHGFMTITDVAEVLYATTSEYDARLDGAIRWNDPVIGIRWPTDSPILSLKDANAPLLTDADHDFVWEVR
jgi:dTDP-4-dehydrorhamnose 3,5-epimerase